MTAVMSLALVTAAAAGAHTISHDKAPSRCPSTASMSRYSGTTMVDMSSRGNKQSLSCSYVNADGHVFLNYVIEDSFGESTRGFWSGMQSSAGVVHAKLHRFRAGKAAAWYNVSRASVYAEVLLGKQEISIEDKGQSGRTVARIAEAFIQ